MTTNYGARTGLTISAEREAAIRADVDNATLAECDLLAELDATRAALAEAREAMAALATKAMRAWRYAAADGVAEVAGIQPEHREAMAILGWRPGGKCFTCGRLWNIRNADGCPDCQ